MGVLGWFVGTAGTLYGVRNTFLYRGRLGGGHGLWGTTSSVYGAAFFARGAFYSVSRGVLPSFIWVGRVWFSRGNLILFECVRRAGVRFFMGGNGYFGLYGCVWCG